MKINLVKLWKESGAKEDFNFVWEDCAEDLGEASLIKPITVKGNVSNRGNYLELSLHLKTEIMLLCSRCLEEVKLPLKLDVTEQFCSKEAGSETERAGNENSLLSFLENEDWLDLKQIVLENLLLSLPMRVLCMPDCPGLCPECGVNLKESKCNCQRQDIDPRFEALAQLKKKMES
ncbi:MAG: DUF177 domain-containing protein [Clostridia bacterium]|jgi:uncharacterized protein|nr:DUF177 domain-containing protein [Clostridia bacterium]